MASDKLLDTLYEKVANDEDARTCTDITDAACREVPGNFFRIISANTLTKIGDLLINPKTVLAWLIGAVGAPASLAGLLVPIRESGSLIPQLMIGALVRRYPVRKGFWVLGAALQGLAVLGMAAVVWWLDGLQAGLGVIGLLVLFSISRGFCSVAMKDVQGKCIPKSRRGRLTGLSATLSGAVTFALTLLLFRGDSDPSMLFYSALLAGAGVAWLVAALVFWQVDEYAGASEGGHNALKEAWGSLSLLKTDPPFRRFVLTRALLMASSLASPFLVLLARDQSDLALMLGSFVLASSLASAISATVWGYMADSSSRAVMIRGGALAALVCLVAGGLSLSGWQPGWLHWLYPGAFFVLAIAHAGVRIGRKTYMVDMAGGTKRTDYTAVSNTVIGVLLLFAGAASAAVAVFGNDWALVVLGGMGAAGVVGAVSLKPV
ncbi:MAG: MFS transporter [Alcanivoracaceae bacterium]|nr:MFS transporter [Alcanivoracaceae bacterium]